MNAAEMIRWLGLAAGGMALAVSLSWTPALAQLPSNLDVSPQVYQQLPNLPKENQYFNTTTSSIATGNTLVSRLLRYHVYVKGRPPNQRLDWKLTLADYIGVNELMEEGRYPSRDVLAVNPMEGDRTAIRRLNRSERETLVQVLVNLFSPSESTPRPSGVNSPAVPTSPTAPTQPAKPPRSGAELLLP